MDPDMFLAKPFACHIYRDTGDGGGGGGGTAPAGDAGGDDDAGDGGAGDDDAGEGKDDGKGKSPPPADDKAKAPPMLTQEQFDAALKKKQRQIERKAQREAEAKAQREYADRLAAMAASFDSDDDDGGDAPKSKPKAPAAPDAAGTTASPEEIWERREALRDAFDDATDDLDLTKAQKKHLRKAYSAAVTDPDDAEDWIAGWVKVWLPGADDKGGGGTPAAAAATAPPPAAAPADDKSKAKTPKPKTAKPESDGGAPQHSDIDGYLSGDPMHITPDVVRQLRQKHGEGKANTLIRQAVQNWAKKR